MARMPGNLRPSEMFQINLLQRLGAQKQRRSPTGFSTIADLLSTVGGAYMQKSIYGDARDREESANKRVLSMLTGTPAVMGTTQRLRSEEEASAAGDLVADDGLGLPMQQAPQEPSKYGVKSAFDLDTIPRDPYSENVGVPMPSLIEMVSKVKTPAVSATTQQLISAMMNRDASPEMRQIAASRYAASVKPETFNLQFSPDGTPFVTSSKTGIKQLPGNFGKKTSTEEKYDMLIEAGIPPKEAMELAAIGRPTRPLAAPNTQISLTGEQFKKRFPEAARGVTDRNLKDVFAITLNPNGTIANIRSEDKDIRMTADGNVLSLSAAVKDQEDFKNYTPRTVDNFNVPLPVDEEKNNVENMSPVDPQGVQGATRPLTKLGIFFSELFGNETEGRAAENLLERTNATAVQIGASLPPSIVKTKGGRGLTNLVRDLEMKKVPTFSTFSSDETFVSEVRSYMNKLNRVRKEVTGIARSPVGTVKQRQAVQYIEAITDLMEDYAYLTRNSEGKDKVIDAAANAAAAVIAKQKDAAAIAKQKYVDAILAEAEKSGASQ